MAITNKADTLFEAVYQRWMAEQIRLSSGERKRKLLEGPGHSEKLFVSRVWWPAFGNFDFLHPEYEVSDFKDGTRFLDFAYLRQGLRLCIEIDPYGTHWSKISRWQYDDNLDRQNDLILDDWKVLRFSKDMVQDNPRHCQLKIQQALGKWGGETSTSLASVDPIDQAIVKLMIRRAAPAAPAEIARELGWHGSTISKHLKRLADKQIIIPTNPDQKRTRLYVVNPAHQTNESKQTRSR